MSEIQDADLKAMVDTATTSVGLIFIKGLETRIRIWQDRLIDSPPREREEFVGAVKHVRDLLVEIKRLPPGLNPNKPETPTTY